jgi:hypothetical protein
MSAQRSRMKQKFHYKNMEKTNKFLIAKNSELVLENSRLRYQNSQLEQEMKKLRELYERSLQREPEEYAY